MKFFIGVIVFLELFEGIAKGLLVMEGDYPREEIKTRARESLQVAFAFALALWGLFLLSP
jgi:hypothetical protein